MRANVFQPSAGAFIIVEVDGMRETSSLARQLREVLDFLNFSFLSFLAVCDREWDFVKVKEKGRD